MGEEAGVVDEHADAAVLAQSGFDALKIAVLGQVGLQHVDPHSRLAAQMVGDLLQPEHVACHQHEIMAAMGKTVGIDGPNAGRGTGDQHRRFLAH